MIWIGNSADIRANHDRTFEEHHRSGTAERSVTGHIAHAADIHRGTGGPAATPHHPRAAHDAGHRHDTGHRARRGSPGRRATAPDAVRPAHNGPPTTGPPATARPPARRVHPPIARRAGGRVHTAKPGHPVPGGKPPAISLWQFPDPTDRGPEGTLRASSRHPAADARGGGRNFTDEFCGTRDSVSAGPDAPEVPYRRHNARPILRRAGSRRTRRTEPATHGTPAAQPGAGSLRPRTADGAPPVAPRMKTVHPRRFPRDPHAGARTAHHRDEIR